MRTIGALCGAVVAACICCSVAIADTPRYPNHHAHACMPPNDSFPFCDTSLAVSDRVADLISRMTLAEKVSMTYDRGSEVDSIGMPDINWWEQGGEGEGGGEQERSEAWRGAERSLGTFLPQPLFAVLRQEPRGTSRPRRAVLFAHGGVCHSLPYCLCGPACAGVFVEPLAASRHRRCNLYGDEGLQQLWRKQGISESACRLERLAAECEHCTRSPMGQTSGNLQRMPLGHGTTWRCHRAWRAARC